jgi:hypothetical protein
LLSLVNFYKTFDIVVKAWGFNLADSSDGENNINNLNNNNNFANIIDKIYQMNEYTKNAFNLLNCNPNYYMQFNKDMNLNYLYNQAYMSSLYQLLSNQNYLSLLNNIGGFNAGQNNNINLLVNLNANTKIIDNSRNNINIINNILNNESTRLKTVFPKSRKNEKNGELTESKNDTKTTKPSKKPTLKDESSEDSGESKLLSRKRGMDSPEDSLTPVYEKKVKTKKVVSSISLSTNYKRALSYKDFEDQEMLLINNIDKPKKKKNKIEVQEKAQLKVDIQNYATTFVEDLAETLKEPAHVFMKDHFPIMYELENYYLYIKQLKERRRTKIKELVSQVDKEIKHNDLSQHVKEEPTTFKKVWNPNVLNNDKGKFSFNFSRGFFI